MSTTRCTPRALPRCTLLPPSSVHWNWPTLLVNYWYAPSVGHAIEGTRYALANKRAYPDLRVYLLLNGATAIELARCCDVIDEVYAVPYAGFLEPDTDPLAVLAGVPSSFDWIVENHRVGEPSHAAIPGFRAFFDARHGYFRPAHPFRIIGQEPPCTRRTRTCASIRPPRCGRGLRRRSPVVTRSSPSCSPAPPAGDTSTRDAVPGS